jgi:hypothetical protein
LKLICQFNERVAASQPAQGRHLIFDLRIYIAPKRCWQNNGFPFFSVSFKSFFKRSTQMNALFVVVVAETMAEISSLPAYATVKHFAARQTLWVSPVCYAGQALVNHQLYRDGAICSMPRIETLAWRVSALKVL